MDSNEKATYFEYVLKKLLAWNLSFNPASGDNDFSMLKSLKLLFFVSAAAGNANGGNILLETVFDRFVAMPYGHVESDVYSEIKRQGGLLPHYKIDNVRSSFVKDIHKEDLDSTITNAIDQAVDNLRISNNRLVRLSQFDLVNLSHAWYSWQKYYTQAKDYGQRSLLIPITEIIAEDKIYSLKSF